MEALNKMLGSLSKMAKDQQKWETMLQPYMPKHERNKLN